MTKTKFLSGIILLMLSIGTMNAQQKTAQNQALSNQQQQIVRIAALTATGNLESLKTALNDGLDAGLSINEIKEVLVQLYAYCGFPRSLNAINSFKLLLEERQSKGIKDTVGKAITMHTNSANKYEQGRKVLETLTKVPQPKPAPGFGEFSPRIDAFLKEHLFADVFESDVLSYQQRELVTISALAAMTGLDSQLRTHLDIGRNTGLTENQLVEVADLIEKCIGRNQANILRKSLSKPEVPMLDSDMMVRIAEIEIVPEFLEEYNAILKEESSASVKLEPGVICIFPMYQKENPTQIRLVEIYVNKAAYQSHIQSPHFQHYKTATLKMVKSLKLIEMSPIDPETMQAIFRKLK